jgi:hypothetical protein
MKASRYKPAMHEFFREYSDHRIDLLLNFGLMLPGVADYQPLGDVRFLEVRGLSGDGHEANQGQAGHTPFRFKRPVSMVA